MQAREEASPLPDHLLLFDGVCNLCNGLVRFVLRHDRRGVFRFSTLQSATARQLLGAHIAEAATTFVYWRLGKPMTRSTAALNVARQLPGAWPLAYGLIVVPRFIRDAVYNLVARHRYNWFGRRGACMVPGPDVAGRFLP